MAVSAIAHQLTNSVTVVVCKGTRGKLESLKAGAILMRTSPADAAGMIEATYEGLPIIIFRRDLEERSTEIGLVERCSETEVAVQSTHDRQSEIAFS